MSHRLLDITLVVLSLPLTLPLAVVTAWQVRRRLGSPVLFRQTRPGLKGALFEMLKFRTMTDARDADGKLLPDAERLTDFGRWLRSTSLDELPGLLNVLRGEMSLVGPRPLLVQYLPRYSPEQARRHAVKPGLTGLAQVRGRNAIGWDEKLALDVWYVDHRTLCLDLRILAETALKVLQRRNINAPGQDTMTEFMGPATGKAENPSVASTHTSPGLPQGSVRAESDRYENYFQHLSRISWLGRTYKRLYSSPQLFFLARRFGPRIIEVGSGTGRGVLGTFPSSTVGLDVNPHAVDYCLKNGLKAQLINQDGTFPVADAAFDSCILDNVLEHIENPQTTLDECWRITRPHGGLVVVVTGVRGFHSDPDHKVFYDEAALRRLDARWTLVRLFAGPFFFRSQRLSHAMRQYGLVAIYKKTA